MRTLFTAAIGLIASIGLAGCDNPGNAPAPTPQAAAPPCNCQTQNAAVAQPAPLPATQRHARTASYREEVENYSYTSPSRSYDQGEAEDQNVPEDQTASQSGEPEGNAWVDGYGRSHYAATASAAPVPDDRARLHPWHGYDENCDEKK